MAIRSNRTTFTIIEEKMPAATLREEDRMEPLLAVTSVCEAVTGLALLAYPPLVVRLLFGAEIAGVGVVISRIGGAALLSIGVICWLARNSPGRHTQLGLLTGVLIYDIAAAALLAHAGLFLDLAGIALWPAVVLHATLAFWCAVCIWDKQRVRRDK
jgi:hypothetical protein